MRGTRARAIRRIIYGDYSPLARKHFKSTNGMIYTDELRQRYQYAKGRRNIDRYGADHINALGRRKQSLQTHHLEGESVASEGQGS